MVQIMLFALITGLFLFAAVLSTQIPLHQPTEYARMQEKS